MRTSAPWLLRTRDAASTYSAWGAGLDNPGISTALVPADNQLLLAGPRGVYRSRPLDRTFGDGFENP